MIKIFLFVLLATVGCRRIHHGELQLVKKIKEAKLLDVLGMFVPFEFRLAEELLPDLVPKFK